MRVTSYITALVASSVLTSVLLTSCGEVGKLEFGTPGSQDKKWEALVAEGQKAQEKNKSAIAEQAYKDAIEVCKKKYGENDGRTATCVGYLAGYYMARQDWKLAYTEYRHWKDILKEVDPDGAQMKAVDDDLGKIKAKLIQYNMVPDEVLKKRAAKKAAEEKAKGAKTDEKGNKKSK